MHTTIEDKKTDMTVKDKAGTTQTKTAMPDLAMLKNAPRAEIHTGLIRVHRGNVIATKEGKEPPEKEFSKYFHLKDVNIERLFSDKSDSEILELFQEFLHYQIEENLARLGLKNKKVSGDWLKMRKWLVKFKELRERITPKIK